MTLRLRVRRRAELDLDEAHAWYAARAEGLGEAFLRSVEACIQRHPEAFAVAHGRVHRARLHRFPYGVVGNRPALAPVSIPSCPIGSAET